MKTTCFVIYGKDIVRATQTGEVDLEASKNRLRELALDAEPAQCEILLDFRWAAGTLALLDMYELAQELGRINPLFDEKIAILFDEDEHHQAREMSTEESGFHVAHFVDFEAATQWLGSSNGG